MSLLTRPTRPGEASETSRPALRSPATLGALAGAQAAIGGLFGVVACCLVVWIAAPRVGAGWVEAGRVAADAWLVAHGTTVVLARGEVSVVPLGLTLLPLALCWSAARRVARALESPDGGVPLRPALWSWATLTAAYAALTTLVAVVVATPAAHPSAGEAAVGGLVVAGSAALAGLAPVVRPRPEVPAALAVPARAAAVALVAWLGVSALLVAGSLVAGRSRVTALVEALSPGAVGGVGLLLLQLVVLPVAVVWAGAWWAGPGFAVGVGTSVSPAATTVGVFPALPLLGGLPDPGTQPGWLVATVAVPVLCGVLAGRSVQRGSRGRLVRLRDAATTAVLTGAVAALLAGAASGAVGAGRMGELGPHAGWVGLVLAGEVLAGCVIGVLLPGGRPALRRPRWPRWLTWPRGRRG